MSESAFGVEHADISKARGKKTVSQLGIYTPVRHRKPKAVSKSAFGVEHVEKAIKLPGMAGLSRLGTSMGRGTSAFGGGMAGAGSQGLRRSKTTMGSVSALGARKTGMSVQRVGGAMQRNPGLTGGVAAGGGAAAVGGGAFAMGQRKQRTI